MAAVCLCALTAFAVFAGCSRNRRQVVVYTSVDQVYSEKIFKAYEDATGVDVIPKYDVEAQKTVGLVNELIGEKDNPQADVFWSGEILQTILLKESGVLASATLANAAGLPESFVDKDNTWFGFGGRARVLLYNKTLISREDLPATMKEIAKSSHIKQAGIAYPIFGTTATQAAVLYSCFGSEEAKAFYQELYDSGIVVLDGNGVVKDYVAQKKLIMGLTDTDDALSEMAVNKDLDILFLDQEEGGIGTLVIPNTVAKIRNGPHPEEADLFMNDLISAETEQVLVDDQWIQIPVHEGVEGPDAIGGKIRIMEVDFNRAYGYTEESKTDLTSIFIR